MAQDAPWDFAWGFDPDNDPAFENAPGWREFRRKARMNTYTVIGPAMSIEDYPPRTNLRDGRTCASIPSPSARTSTRFARSRSGDASSGDKN
jgi:hypothetical protein